MPLHDRAVLHDRGVLAPRVLRAQTGDERVVDLADEADHRVAERARGRRRRRGRGGGGGAEADADADADPNRRRSRAPRRCPRGRALARWVRLGTRTRRRLPSRRGRGRRSSGAHRLHLAEVVDAHLRRVIVSTLAHTTSAVHACWRLRRRGPPAAGRRRRPRGARTRGEGSEEDHRRGGRRLGMRRRRDRRVRDGGFSGKGRGSRGTRGPRASRRVRDATPLRRLEVLRPDAVDVHVAQLRRGKKWMFLNRGLVSAGTVTMGNREVRGGGGGRGTPECARREPGGSRTGARARRGTRAAEPTTRRRARAARRDPARRGARDRGVPTGRAEGWVRPSEARSRGRTGAAPSSRNDPAMDAIFAIIAARPLYCVLIPASARVRAPRGWAARESRAFK